MQRLCCGLAVVCPVGAFFPAFALGSSAGELFGNPVKGNVNPVSMYCHDWCFYFWYWHAVGGAVHRVPIHGRRWRLSSLKQLKILFSAIPLNMRKILNVGLYCVAVTAISIRQFRLTNSALMVARAGLGQLSTTLPISIDHWKIGKIF